jgi:non-canonical poly(A) RNA polymerase PAPD5/7
VLDALEATLKKKKWVEDSKCIRNTTVPVLKITCSKQYSSKKVDISIQETRHNGLHCVELVKDYLAMFPPLRTLVLALKQFLFTLNLNDTYSVALS